MEIKDEIREELRYISPVLTQISRENLLSVPPNYFENTEERIALYMKKIRQGSSTWSSTEGLLPAMPSNPLQVPGGYFNQLSNNILSRIKNSQNSEYEDFPVLQSLKKNNLLSVPDNYFENLSTNILAAIHRKPQARVISFTKTAWWKYAAAAVFTGILLISAFFVFNKSNDHTSNFMSAIEEYSTFNQITQGIENLPEEAIIQYLEIYSRSSDNDMLINNVDTKDLPGELDYLMDENTLNTYLERINFKNQ